MLSIVISTFNESNNHFFVTTLNNLQKNTEFELICIDGGSTDGTIELIKQHDAQLTVLPNSTRGARLNHGIQQARYNNILLHHPRSLLSTTAVEYLNNTKNLPAWGAFRHTFDDEHFFLKFISWYSNQVRVLRKNIVYLDHCILVQKEHLIANPIPDLAIFEDTALSIILQQQNLTAQLIPHTVTTSAIRFRERGIYRQFAMNQLLKFLYSLNCSSKFMNKLYEKKLNLNQNNS